MQVPSWKEIMDRRSSPVLVQKFLILYYPGKFLVTFERKEELKAVVRNEWFGLFSHLWSWGVNFRNPKYLECASLSKILYGILSHIISKLRMEFIRTFIGSFVL